jgi:Spy/CpxP family protein refolding chaperone
MNKMISAILVGSITLGGLSLAVASDDEYRGKHQGKYCKHGKGGDHKMGHHKKGMEQRMQRMMHRLDLNDEQTSKVSAVFDKHRTQFNSLRSKMKSNRVALRENMHADTQDMAVIEKLAKKQGELKTQKILIKAKIKSAINKILNKEQREKMKNIRAKRSQRRHGIHE